MEENDESREAEWLRSWTPLAVDYGEYDPLRAGSIDGTDTAPHDRGIVRAMRAYCEVTHTLQQKYLIKSLLISLDKPPRNLSSDPECTMFVGRLNRDTTEGKFLLLPVLLGRVNK